MQNRFWLMENPRSSELWRQPVAARLQGSCAGHVESFCMCAHGMVCPATGKPTMKPTSIMGNMVLDRVLKWCPKNHVHQVLNGSFPGGGSRTTAQVYP